MVALLGAPFLLPAIVAVFGILAIWGRAGLFSRGLEALGLPGLDVYGLGGVVLAHVFFNLALVARLLLQGWLAIPANSSASRPSSASRRRTCSADSSCRCCARCCPAPSCWSSCSA